MCQNNFNDQTKAVYGHIVITKSGCLLFTTSPREGQIYISSRVGMNMFHEFAAYLRSFQILEGVKLHCCIATVKNAYQEFLIEQMISIHNISKLPQDAPEVKALNTSSVNGRFNIWLNKARRLLQHATGAGFFN